MKPVTIVWAIDILISRHIGIDSCWAKHIQGSFDLQGESVSQLEWDLAISCGKHADKVILKYLYCPLY